ncbi:hypothetical protein AAEY27_12630 [Kosakonia sp. BYX6]|uniref:Uncharacterized protein n=1 Tax=Kosakonia calanthes TaxID=3139408 RepID=A0ABZ3B0B1_9ENTR
MNAICAIMPPTDVMRVTAMLVISDDWFMVLRITSGIPAAEAPNF